MKNILVIYHKADFDGIFCREIARQFLGENAEYVGWDYGDSDAIVPPGIERIYMLDISIESWMNDPRLIWIDHHNSAIKKFSPAIPGYRIDGVAACRLACQWFSYAAKFGDPEDPRTQLPVKEAFVNRDVSEPYAVQLAGEYDVWDKRNPEVDVWQFALRSKKLTEQDWKELLAVNLPGVPALALGLMQNGCLLQNYQQEQDASLVKHRSYLTHFDGLKCLALNTARCNSLTFAERDLPETGHDALLGYFYDGAKWKFSLYHARHRTDLDLSAIAGKYGGGGHRGACGFHCETLPWMEKVK